MVLNMHMSGQKFDTTRPGEVVFDVPTLTSTSSGALALKASVEMIEDSVEEVEDQARLLELQLAQAKAQGRVEHLRAVFEGKEQHFLVYFVLGLDTHDDMHHFFVEELGLPEPSVDELSKHHEPRAVLVEGDFQLTRHSNVYENGVAYDVTYQTAPLES